MKRSRLRKAALAIVLPILLNTCLIGCDGRPNLLVYGSGDATGGGPNGSGGSLSGLGGESNGTGASSSVDPNAACATETKEAQPAVLDMGILVDTSYSMDFDDKWVRVSNALKTFSEDPNYADLGVALQFYPLRLRCKVEEYAKPAVTLALLSEAAPDVVKALDAQQMADGTPMVQALQGMGQYLGSFRKSLPDHKRVIVLATDGLPDVSCSGESQTPPNSLENAAMIAKELAEDTSPIETFVIGVGDELEALDTIAEAGGTDKAIIISTSGDVQKSFLEALARVRQSSLPCDYAIPESKTGLDLEKVNVLFSAPGLERTTFVYASSSGICGDAEAKGWYFDDPVAPKKIVLCPDTCKAVNAVAGARVDTVFGCKRVDVIVK